MREEEPIPIPGENGTTRSAAQRKTSYRPSPEKTDFHHAALVVNTRSRVGESACLLARDLLEEAGVPVGAAYALRDPVRLPETVQGALSEGHDLIVLGGGDGSVSSVVNLLAGRDAVLGLLPLGTANDFARTLGIPFDLRDACDTIAHGRVVDVDLGLAGDNYYINVASVGLGTEIVEKLSPRLKRIAGPLAYSISAVRAYANHRPFSAMLIFPDGDHDSVFLDGLLQVAVGNGRFYGGGMVVAPGSRIDDKALDVFAIKNGRGWELVGVARHLKTGEFVENPRVHYWRTSRVQVETDHELPINLDGELVSHTPKLFSVAPDTLKVLVPESSTSVLLDEASAARELVLNR